MTKNEIDGMIKAAAKGGIDRAIAGFLGLEVEFKAAGNKVPPGCESAFGAIRAEVEQWKNADSKTRAAIEQYKAAKG